MGEMLLLGAGASIEAGVPDTYRLTRAIAEKFRSRRGSAWQVITLAIGGLLFQEGARGRDPLTGVNVEELFSAVELLANRTRIEAAPFIGSWHSAVEELDRGSVPRARLHALQRAFFNQSNRRVNPFHNSNESDIDREVVNLIQRAVARGGAYSSGSVGRAVAKLVKQLAPQPSIYGPAPNSAFDNAFANAVEALTKSGEGRVFRETAEQMIRALISIVWVNDASLVSYLRPVLDLLRTQGRLVVATLNYDNCIELLASGEEVVCNTGIETWSESRRFAPANEGLHLLKLHGSVDWALTLQQVSVTRPLPQPTVTRVSLPLPAGSHEFRPAVVFGQRNKLTAEGPYLDLLHCFKEELERTSRLTVVGYSFRDSHVNEHLSIWLNASPGRRLRIIDPGFMTNRAPYCDLIRGLAATRLEVLPVAASAGLQAAFGGAGAQLPLGIPPTTNPPPAG